MFAVAVFIAILFTEISTADETSCAAGGFYIRVDECSRIFPDTNTSIDYKEQFYLRTQLHHFKPLITTNCSSLTRLFICLSHLPLCTSHYDIPPLLPCRSVCDHVYFNCIHHFHKTQLPWPHHLNCSR